MPTEFRPDHEWNKDVSLLLLRLAFGETICLYHGLNKLPVPESMLADAVASGVSFPGVLVWAAVVIELVGGFCLAAGLFTRSAALGILGIMLAAAFIRYADEPAPYVMKERALAYGVVALAVLIAGPGRYALDALRRRQEPM